ncbi:MAG: glycosyltransferase family 2 protein [Paludibacteraceae bacterium]|nr:glycosyltransferase family 2 protein [Paludibacteraceae bacterium]
MKVAVVILNWNGRNMLERFLPSVCRFSQQEGVEVVVADNASTDDSLSFLTENYPDVRQVVLDRNYGFADGYNRSLAQIEAEYFVLLNSDVEVTEHWLDPLISYMDAHSDVAVCQPKIRSQAAPSFFEHAGAAGGFMDKFGYPFCRGRILSVVEEDKGQYDTECDLFWATGAAFFVRAEAYWACGGLDADFFAHMEEIDLCWRMRSRGYRIVCLPQSVVFHVGGGTLNASNPHKTYLNYRNNLLMIYKNALPKQLRKMLLARYFLDYLSAFVFLLKGEVGNFKAVFSARSEYSKMKKNFTQKRKENMERVVNETIKEIFPKSIVGNFYLRKISRFSSLKW